MPATGFRRNRPVAGSTETTAPWIDPVLLRGDPAGGLGRVLWSRLDDVVVGLFELFVRVAAVAAERAARWVTVRAMRWCVFPSPAEEGVED